jgi:hypothetical protein
VASKSLFGHHLLSKSLNVLACVGPPGPTTKIKDLGKIRPGLLFWNPDLATSLATICKFRGKPIAMAAIVWIVRRFACAEHEAKAISDRTRAALAAGESAWQAAWRIPWSFWHAGRLRHSPTSQILGANARAAGSSAVLEERRTEGANSLRSIAKG